MQAVKSARTRVGLGQDALNDGANLFGDLPQRVYQLACSIVRRKGRSLIGKYGFTSSDLDDLQQDLLADLVRAWPHFSSRLGTPSSFVNLLVDRRIASRVRFLRASKRGGGDRIGSLDIQLEDKEGNQSSLGDVLPEAASDSRLGVVRRDLLDASDLREDVEAILLDLPSDQRKIAEYLMTCSKRKTAEISGVSRRQIDQVIEKMRVRFEDSDLQDYL